MSSEGEGTSLLFPLDGTTGGGTGGGQITALRQADEISNEFCEFLDTNSKTSGATAGIFPEIILLDSPTDKAISPDTGSAVDRFLPSAPPDSLSAQDRRPVNPFTGRRNADPFIGLEDTVSPGGISTGNVNRAVLGFAISDDTGTFTTAPRQYMPTNIIYGQIPTDTRIIGGKTYAHYLVTVNGVTYDAFLNDVEDPNRVWVAPTSSSIPPVLNQAAPAASPTSVPSGAPPTSSPAPIDTWSMLRLLSRLWVNSLHIPSAPPLRQIEEFGAGVARGVEDALTPLGVGGMLPTAFDSSRPFELGRGLGQMGLGIAEMGAGAGGEVGATLLDVTGLGALVGIPANIASAELILQGGAASLVGAKNFGHAMSSMGGDSGGPNSPPGEPPPGPGGAGARGAEPHEPAVVRPSQDVRTGNPPAGPASPFVPKTGAIKVFRPIRPGERYLDYGKEMHLNGLKRYFELRYPDAKVTLNTRPGVTGPDVEVQFADGRAPLNFRFGELKTIRTPVSSIQRQAEFNWGYEIGDGRLFFYDRWGYMMEGVVDRPPL